MESLVKRQQSIQQLRPVEPLHTDQTPKMQQPFRKFDLKTISHDLARAPLTSKVKKITKNVANKKRTEVAYTPYNFGISKGFPQSKTSSSKILFPVSIKPTCFTSQVSPLHKNLYFDERRTRRLRPSINTGLFMT